MSRAETEQPSALFLEGLSSPDAEVRRLAVEQLSQLPVEEALPHLEAQLGDPDWRVRKAVVARVQPHLGQMQVQEMLVAALADEQDAGRRNSAYESLISGGAIVAPRLARELENPDPDVRKQAIDALGEIGDTNSKGALVAAADDADLNVRAAAFEALGHVGGVAEINLLLEAVRDEDQDVLVRLSAIRALTRMEVGVGVNSLGAASDNSLLRPAIFTLFAYSEDEAATECLLKGLADARRSMREAAMQGLLSLLSRRDDLGADRLRGAIAAAAIAAEGFIEQSCDRLRAGPLSSRLVTIQFLGLLGSAEVVVPILEACDETALEGPGQSALETVGPLATERIERDWAQLSPAARVRAAGFLATQRTAAASRLLVTALADEGGEVRCAAARALAAGEFEGVLPEVLNTLERAARNGALDQDEEEVSVLIRSVVRMAERSSSAGDSASEQIFELLSSRLGGAPEAVRLAIAQVLSRLGGRPDPAIIEYLLKDEKPRVRRAAVSALVRIGFEAARPLLRLALGDESIAVRVSAARVLGELDHDAAESELKRLLADSDDRLVCAALRSLGRFYGRRGDLTQQAMDGIAQHLHSGAAETLAATEALAEMGGPAAVRFLSPVLRRDEPEIVRSAVGAIGQHAEERFLEALLPAVNHSDWSVRAEVARVLSERGYQKALPALLARLDVEEDPFARETVLRATQRLED